METDISIPMFNNVIPTFNNNVQTDQSLKEDHNATIAHSDNNTMDDQVVANGGINIWA